MPYMGHARRKSGTRGRCKSNLESNYSSESKTSKEFLKAEKQLTEIGCGPDSTKWTKSF